MSIGNLFIPAESHKCPINPHTLGFVGAIWEILVNTPALGHIIVNFMNGFAPIVVNNDPRYYLNYSQQRRPAQ